MSWTDLILVAVLVAGVMIAMRARVGRLVLARPRCAGCRQQLTGFEMEGDARCPECGADLNGRAAVRYGRTTPYRWRFRLGLLLVLGAVLTIGGRTAQRYAKVEWAHLRPTSWVLRDLQRPERRPAAWQELVRRLDAGRLDDDDIAVAVEDVIGMLEQGMVVPIDGRGKARPPSKLLMQVLAEGRVSETQMERLIVAAVESGLAVDLHPRVRWRDWASFAVSSRLRQVMGEQRLVHLRAVRDANGNELPVGHHAAGFGYGPPDHSRESLSAGGGTYLEGRVRVPLSPGEHELTFVFDLGAAAEGVVPAKRPGAPERWPDTRHRWTATRTARIEVVDPKHGEPVFDLVPSGAIPPGPGGPSTLGLDEQMRRRVRIAGWRIGAQHGVETVSLDMRVASDEDLTLAFDIILRFDGQQRKFGTCTVVAGARTGRGGRPVGVTGLRAALPDDLSTIDVILRSNPSLVENTLGVERVWGGELVFEDIPMVNAASPPPPPPSGSRSSGAGGIGFGPGSRSRPPQ
jgi:predicted RNA-binding Zn-ribbon protein involved in translation (DUF1610 family)